MLQDVGSSSQGPGARACGGVVTKGIERAAAPRPVNASAPCRCDGEGEAQAAAQGAMHIVRWEGEAFVVRDGDEPGSGLRTRAAPEKLGAGQAATRALGGHGEVREQRVAASHGPKAQVRLRRRVGQGQRRG